MSAIDMNEPTNDSESPQKNGYEALPVDVLDFATAYDFFSAVSEKITQLVERKMKPAAGVVTQKYYNEVMSKLELAFVGNKEGEQPEMFYGLPLIKLEDGQEVEEGFYLLVMGDKPPGAKAVPLEVEYPAPSEGGTTKREGWCFLVEWGNEKK
jgi:hypothetical protein